MNDHQPLRDALSMSRAQIAALVGGIPSAVAQYEWGRCTPTGDDAGFYERLRAAHGAAVVTETVGHRVTTMPVHRWERVIDSTRIGRVFLPVRLHWSPTVVEGWDLADVDDRHELYTQLLDVGAALDVMVFIDPDELAQWSNDLLVSRSTRPMLDRLVERISGRVGHRSQQLTN